MHWGKSSEMAVEEELLSRYNIARASSLVLENLSLPTHSHFLFREQGDVWMIYSISAKVSNSH